MSNFVLLVETGSDIPAEMAQRYGIYTVPMHVAFGEDSRDDGSFPVEDIYRYFEQTGKLTQTSGCTPGDFEVIYDRIQAEQPGKHILHLAYSAVTTCSYQSAIIAAEGREGITSVDTKHVTAGQTMVALLMARYLEENPDCSVNQAVSKAKEISEKCRMGFFPGDLAYLRAGGRVSNAAYMGAKILQLNPLIELLNGYLTATKKYRGKMDKVALKMMDDFVETHRFDRSVIGFVYSEGLSDSIRAAVDEKVKELGFKESFWVRAGGVITTHCGPGGFGVCGISTVE